MLALKITGGILLLFALLLLVRVGCRVDYDADGLTVWLKVACFRFQLLPDRTDQEKKEAKRRRKEQKKARKDRKKDGAKPDTPEKNGETPPKKGDLRWLLQLVEPALRALGRLRRRLRVEYVRAGYAIGGAGDPAAAAVKYGAVSAGGGALLPLMNAALDVRDWDLDLSVDFESAETRVALSAAGTYRVGQLIAIMLALAFSALDVYMRHQNQLKKEEELKHGRKASNR